MWTGLVTNRGNPMINETTHPNEFASAEAERLNREDLITLIRHRDQLIAALQGIRASHNLSTIHNLASRALNFLVEND